MNLLVAGGESLKNKCVVKGGVTLLALPSALNNGSIIVTKDKGRLLN